MAGRGGARPGAGRKPGSANKKSQEIAAKLMAEGLTPLEYMLRVMRDEKEDAARRMDAAKSAAPYMHPKLAPLEQGKGKEDDLASVIRDLIGKLPS